MYQTIAILYIRIKFKLSLPSRTEWYVTGVYDLFFVSIKTTRVVHQQINLRATYQVTAKSRNLLSQAGQPLHRKQTSRQTPPPQWKSGLQQQQQQQHLRAGRRKKRAIRIPTGTTWKRRRLRFLWPMASPRSRCLRGRRQRGEEDLFRFPLDRPKTS